MSDRTVCDFVSRSPEQTLETARALGGSLEGGDVVALVGELGAGKTWFVKGLAEGAGVSNAGEVKSPSFVLINIYRGRFPIYHIDAYRLSGPEDFEDLGCDEFLHAPDKLVAIEWADRVMATLDEPYLLVRLEHAGDAERRIAIEWVGRPPHALELPACE